MVARNVALVKLAEGADSDLRFLKMKHDHSANLQERG